MNQSTTPPRARYGIRSVSRLTGLSQALIRTWETRYAVVKSTRADNGRRLYTQADVDRLALLHQLVERGESISQMATLDTEGLLSHWRALDTASQPGSPEEPSRELRVAVLGDFLPARLETAEGLPAGLQMVTCSASIPKFRADIRRLSPDVLIIEMPVLDHQSSEFVAELGKESGAARIIVLYGFGRKVDLTPLHARGVVLLRSPCSLESLFSILTGGLSAPPPPSSGTTRPAQPEPDLAASIPPRRFGNSELARLANATATIDCECPHHLVDLVNGLSAFEAYSAACENRNDEDAALHAWLHRTTATVRATMERALEKVARAEGLIH